MTTIVEKDSGGSAAAIVIAIVALLAVLFLVFGTGMFNTNSGPDIKVEVPNVSAGTK